MSLARAAWGWLERELDAWGEQGLCADFWWRDDDAVEASPQLDQLLQISDRYTLPLALAVIPAALQPNLAPRLLPQPRVSVLQHGFSHQSNAAPGQRKLELGGDCDEARIIDQLGHGQQLLQQSFGNQFSAVMVPPWNRIDARIVAALPGLGYRGISTMRVRRNAWPAARLLQVNTHLDPVNWRHQRGFIGLYPATAILVQHLVARRTGYREMQEPTGVLSHHLVQNAAVWAYLDQLFDFLKRHPACAWRDAPSIWNASTR